MWQNRFPGQATSTLFLGVALAASTSVSAAQGGMRPLFEWSGRVDREVQITMRGRNVWTKAYGQSDERLPGPDIASPLPRDEGVVRVRHEGGQGEVQVLQQPAAENDFTAIVRIRDRSNSGELNRISVQWLPYISSGGEVVEREDTYAPGRYPGERRVMHWTGRVDDALELRIRGDRITYRTLSGDGPDDVNVSMADYGVPIGDVQARVHQLDGRGTVSIVQQPSERNDYTTIIRIYDPQPRSSFYDFDLTVRNR
jgi:hypothetical protein